MRSLRCMVLLGILHNCIQATHQCSPPFRWTPQAPAERAKRADFVIVGTVIRGPRAKQRSTYAALGSLYSATFRVQCIIKGQSLPEFVNVTGFGSAPGLCTSSAALLNRTYIAFLRGNLADQGSNAIGGGFSVHEVNVQEATLRLRPKTDKTLIREIIGSVGRNVSLPVGVRNSSKAGCSALVQHATRKQRTSEDHCNLNHMKRRRKENIHRCRKRHHRLKTTRRPSAITLEPSTLESITGSRVSGRRTSHGRSSSESGAVQAFAAHQYGASHVKSGSWCLVLMFHGLASLVVKYHQT